MATFGSRAVLLFDNAEVALGLLPGLADKLAGEARPPILVVASRTNDFDRKVGRFSKAIKIHEFAVPNLTRGEIEAVIHVLDRNSLLGHLQGMNSQQRIKEFEVRSSKQILIAMREATSGKGFDQIIESEFENLEPQESKTLYLCVALATEAGYRLTEQEFVGCANVTPAEALHLLNRNLKDIVIPSGPGEDMLMLRHRQIAEYAVDRFAPRALVRDAYVRLLRVLANEIRGKKWRSRTFGLYRDVINHLTIFKRFAEEIDEARSIYDALSNDFKSDAQFWLQYGSLELEGGNLEYAENYINQAESLDSDNMWIQNAKGHLLLRKGVEARTKAEAMAYRDAGSEILLENIARTDVSDAYCYHIYTSQRHKWMHHWLTEDTERAQELESLRKIMKDAIRNYPRNRQLRELHEGIEREYLSLAVDAKGR